MANKVADGPWWVREKLPDKKRKKRTPIRCRFCEHLVAPSHMHRHHKSTQCRAALQQLDVANRGLVRLWVCAPRSVYEEGGIRLERIGNTWYAPPWAHTIVKMYRTHGLTSLISDALYQFKQVPESRLAVIEEGGPRVAELVSFVGPDHLRKALSSCGPGKRFGIAHFWPWLTALERREPDEHDHARRRAVRHALQVLREHQPPPPKKTLQRLAHCAEKLAHE